MARSIVTALLITVVLLACGGGARARVTPGPMPEGGNFTGVWNSPQYGQMHMRQTGVNVVCEYTRDERRGRIEGTAVGNLLRFQWTEQREMVVGRTTTTRGRGYFRYVIDEYGNHGLDGEWGLDNDETGGGPWRAIKARRARPHLSTDPPEVGSDEEESSSGGESGSGSQQGGDGLDGL